MKLLRVVGARPQFMQAAVLRKELDKRQHQEILVHTGQHYDKAMSQIFFEDLGIPLPDIDLGIGSGSHGVQTGAMLSKLDEIILDVKPNLIVVDGDTNSTLAGALAGSKLHVPVVHVEAGLRSFDRHMPEEVNRIVADHLSDLLCAPTSTALANLAREGLEERAVLTGDLMYDCFLHYKDNARNNILGELKLDPQCYILATMHRAENTDTPARMKGILSALAAMPLPVIFPVHPRTENCLKEFLSENGNIGAIRPIAPIGYLEMLALECNAQCILTDSGGVQREAFFAGVPSVILRDTTEWKEQVQSGWSILAGAEKSRILEAYEAMKVMPPNKPDVYGDGKASSKVVDAMEKLFQ